MAERIYTPSVWAGPTRWARHGGAQSRVDALFTHHPNPSAKEEVQMTDPEHRTNVYATPLVRNLAAKAGVDLATVVGTGTGGRITPADIRALMPPRAAVLAAAPAQPTPSLIQERRSHWPAYGDVKIDAYSSNPLVEDCKQATPPAYSAALNLASPPTLFPTGDLPLFTAAGFDPGLLMTLPTVVRHMAAASDSVKAAEIFERCGGGDLRAVSMATYMAAESSSPGWSAYVARVNTWVAATPPQREYGVVIAR